MCHFAVAVQKIVRCCKQVLGKQLNSKAVRGEGAREVTHLAQRYELMPGKSFSHRNSQRSLRFEDLWWLCCNKGRKLLRKQFA